MKDIFIKVKSFFITIYLIPFIFYMVYDVYKTSKLMNIPIKFFFYDSEWIGKYLNEKEELSFQISTGVWIGIYTIYILIK